MEQYINKAAVVAEIEDWRDNISKGIFNIPLHGHQKADATFEYEILGRVKDFLDTLEVKEFDMPALDNRKMSVERWKEACKAACSDKNYRSHYGLTETRDDYFVDGVQWADEHPKEEPVSEELDKAAIKFSKGWGEWDYAIPCFKAGAQWQKNHLWKPADGDDLPKIDREVIALIRLDGFFQLPPDEPVELTYKVVFAHRPNPDGWDGKSLTTGNVEHYTPKTYGEGGWNIPDIVYWLDVELPKEIEL